jgi:hypothetical protein
MLSEDLARARQGSWPQPKRIIYLWWEHLWVRGIQGTYRAGSGEEHKDEGGRRLHYTLHRTNRRGR